MNVKKKVTFFCSRTLPAVGRMLVSIFCILPNMCHLSQQFYIHILIYFKDIMFLLERVFLYATIQLFSKYLGFK